MTLERAADSFEPASIVYNIPMPEPTTDPQYPAIRRVATRTLIAGVLIFGLKFSVFLITNSAAVLSDALESIINIAAAAMMLYSIYLSNRPADREHPYGHGKVEFMVAGLEGWMILIAGVVIFVEAIHRIIQPVQLDMDKLGAGTWALGGIGILTLALAAYVYFSGRKYKSVTLTADGKHLLTDAASTLGVIVGLIVVRATNKHWLDPLVALLIAAVIFYTSWRLLWESVNGLMDRRDETDDAAIHTILDQEVGAGAIRGYHKVRHRHSGNFHWVEMHLQVDPAMDVTAAHELASRIEHRIEQALGLGDATAHIEPAAPGIAPGSASGPNSAA